MICYIWTRFTETLNAQYKTDVLIWIFLRLFSFQSNTHINVFYWFRYCIRPENWLAHTNTPEHIQIAAISTKIKLATHKSAHSPSNFFKFHFSYERNSFICIVSRVHCVPNNIRARDVDEAEERIIFRKKATTKIRQTIWVISNNIYFIISCVS